MVQTSLNSDVKLAQNLPAIKDELNLIYGIYKLSRFLPNV